jgi:hypothetical protein
MQRATTQLQEAVKVTVGHPLMRPSLDPGLSPSWWTPEVVVVVQVRKGKKLRFFFLQQSSTNKYKSRAC